MVFFGWFAVAAVALRAIRWVLGLIAEALMLLLWALGALVVGACSLVVATSTALWFRLAAAREGDWVKETLRDIRNLDGVPRDWIHKVRQGR